MSVQRHQCIAWTLVLGGILAQASVVHADGNKNGNHREPRLSVGSRQDARQSNRVADAMQIRGNLLRGEFRTSGTACSSSRTLYTDLVAMGCCSYSVLASIPPTPAIVEQPAVTPSPLNTNVVSATADEY